MVKYYVMAVNPKELGLPSLLMKRGCMETYTGTEDQLGRARSWATARGVTRFIEAEKEAGSDWVYALWATREG
jgi:hypothetical protein